VGDDPLRCSSHGDGATMAARTIQDDPRSTCLRSGYLPSATIIMLMHRRDPCGDRIGCRKRWNHDTLSGRYPPPRHHPVPTPQNDRFVREDRDTACWHPIAPAFRAPPLPPRAGNVHHQKTSSGDTRTPYRFHRVPAEWIPFPMAGDVTNHQPQIALVVTDRSSPPGQGCQSVEQCFHTRCM
jgi:hypothetical protein